jgi:hypothetical protein
MTRTELLFTTDVPLTSVMSQLKRAGYQHLWVRILYPVSRYSEHIPSTVQQADAGQSSQISYTFDVGAATSPVIHLAYGLRRRDEIRAAALPIVFLFLPILITLWMQGAALRDAERDPTGAWFSYLRVLNWCSNGLFLLWTVGHSIRQGLEVSASYALAGHDFGAALLSVMILMVPPWIVYLICILSSYRVYVHVRGETWTRGEFLSNQLLGVATQLLHLMCLIAGIIMLAVNVRVAMVLFLGVYFTYITCIRLKLKVSGTHPEALTTGDLRDRVFQLAKKAAVEVRQLFIMPAGKSQMAKKTSCLKLLLVDTADAGLPGGIDPRPGPCCIRMETELFGFSPKYLRVINERERFSVLRRRDR